jgi:pentose-5-phosphate-3-epimerase
VKEAGMKVGVALKPGTPAQGVYALCDAGLVDMVLVMTVVGPGRYIPPRRSTDLIPVS